MIWLKLSVLVIFALSCDSDKRADPYLLYAVERTGSVIGYLRDLNLQNPREIFQLQNTTLDKMYLSKDKQGSVVYWSQKDSSVIGRNKVSTSKTESKKFSEENTIFLGLGENDALYLYSPSSKSISVFEYESGKRLLELKILYSNTDMHCFDVDPGDRELIFFTECSDDTYSGKCFDTRKNDTLRHLPSYLPTCFDMWSIMPNGEGAYAVKGKEVYKTPRNNDANAHKYLDYAPIKENIVIHEDIVGFAAGNNEFFYGSEGKTQSKIFKATQQGDGYERSEIEVDGTIKLLDLYIQPKRNYLLYATESGGTLEFVKTDLDLWRTKTLKKLNSFQEFDEMHFGYSNDGDILYWSFKKSNVLKRFEISTGKEVERVLGQEFGKLLGAGIDDKVYFYNPDNKIFTVYNYKNNVKEWQHDFSEEFVIHSLAIDPLNREQVLLAECTKTGQKFTKVLDVNQKKILKGHNHELQNICSDVWGVTPNGEKLYAVHQQNLYMSPKDGGPFVKSYLMQENTQALVVGNNDIFFTTEKAGPRRIHKNLEFNQTIYGKHIDANGRVKALAIHQEW